MDPVSLGIIVTVLSFGTILLLLFKVDFAKRRGGTKAAAAGSQQQGESISMNTKSSKSNKNNGNKTGPHSQQANKQQNGLSSNQSNPPKKPQSPIATVAPNGVDCSRSMLALKSEEKTKLKHDIPDLIASHEPKGFVQASSKQHSSTTANGSSNSSNKPVKRKEPKPAKPAAVVVSEYEPPLDELDSSIAMDMYNPLTSAKHRASNKKRQSVTLGADSFEGILLSREMGSTTPSYSSEQLFTMIAASNLSRDEVESAVEMLLNKIDSGDSDWKKPKSDPVERLKNQLRDNENVLSIEIQNHEQTRARLNELKGQIQGERQSSSKLEEELSKTRKELSVANLALEQARADVSRLQTVTKQRDEENAKMIARLEQEKLQLQTIIANESARGVDYETMRVKYDEKLVQLQRYELNQQKMNERIAELENKLRVADHLVDELRASKQHDDYEASAKISELKSDRIQLDKALKDQIARFKEISEANHLLGKTIQELRLINNRQDEMLKQMTDERQVHEASMKRTLQEMELELKELQQKLNANTILSQQDEKVRRLARDTNDANHRTAGGERELKLISEMNELRAGLAALFPDAVKTPSPSSSSTDSSSNGGATVEQSSNSWVQDYVIALKQLSKTLDELKEPNNNNNNSVNKSTNSESPKKSTSDKSTLTPTRKKTPSPTHNGRSSRASTYHGHTGDKKVQETKLLEPEDASLETSSSSNNKLQMEAAAAGDCIQ